MDNLTIHSTTLAAIFLPAPFFPVFHATSLIASLLAQPLLQHYPDEPPLAADATASETKNR